MVSYYHVQIKAQAHLCIGIITEQTGILLEKLKCSWKNSEESSVDIIYNG